MQINEAYLEQIKLLPNAAQLLTSMIQETEEIEQRTGLYSVCWSSGIDCREYLKFFIEKALIESFENCIEIFSIVDGMEQPVDQGSLTEAVQLLENGINEMQENISPFYSDEKKKFLNELLTLLHTFFNK